MSPDDMNSGSPDGTSGAAFEVSKAAQVTSAKNVYFDDADSPWSYHISSELDDTYKVGGTTDASLGDFLSRPLNIATYQWTPSAQLFNSFNPWSLYFGNANVLEKMNRFRNFRCTMCVKFMLNGNAFYYGRALVSYNPYNLNDDVTKNRAFFEEDIVGASQKPHVLLDPCSSQGAEMCLPFVFPENWLDITEPGWEDNLGLFTIHDFDVLQHANGGTDPITVNVFAWCENVELCIPTTLSAQAGDSSVKLDNFGYPIYTSQAKSKGKGGPKKSKATKKMSNTGGGDEFKQRDGLISKPASAVAAAANALSMIPMIAPYAKATSMVATKVGQVAKLFGYSRPNVLKDMALYVPRYVGNISNTDVPETLVKLSLDSKNELTIDSRVTGMNGADELTIHSIASRESYVAQFDWPESAVTNSHLFSIQADPTINRNFTVGPVTEIHNTALGFATLPFKYWQGTIKFRFMVICSEYHRGRLRIIYDPRTLGSTDYNLTYSTTIDITEHRDFEYEVKWTQPRAWQEVRTMDGAVGTTLFSDSNPTTVNGTNNNGQLSVYVLNELATPSTTAADVKVLVWMSAGDDYAVAVPRSWESFNRQSYFEEQSAWTPFMAQGNDAILATTQDSSNIPVDSDPLPVFGNSYIPDDDQYLVYQGERIVSFRELLRRYYYHTSYMNDNQGGSIFGIRRYNIQNFPKYRGWDPNGSNVGVDSTAGNAAFTYANVTLMNYLAPAFVCRRGGIRIKYILSGRAEDNLGTPLFVARLDDLGENETSFTQVGNAAGLNNGGPIKAIVDNYSTGSGAFITPCANNPVAEIELPFYTQGKRFVQARDIQYNTSRDHPRHTICGFTDNLATADASRFDAFIAAAEDFNLSFFVGAPVMYDYVNPTPGT